MIRARSVLSALVLLGCPASAAASLPEEIIVKHGLGVRAAERADARAAAGVRLEGSLGRPRVEVVSVADGSQRAGALAVLRADPDVAWAEPSRPRRLATGDPLWAQQWALANTGQAVLGVTGTPDADIDAEEAWLLARGSGTTVAVVDTGVQAGHPDLGVLAGWDFVGEDADAADAHGHGTHVAGTIGARENAVGAVGVAPLAQILPIRVLDDNGEGSTVDSAQGFAYAGERGARIVNVSISASGYSRAEFEAIRAHPRTLYVIAAGNDASDNDARPAYPCSYALANVVCVGASDQADEPARFSNRGAQTVDLHAPGVNVVSTIAGSGYDYMSGSSMASPHVAGAAALLAERHPGASATELKQALLAGTDRAAALASRSLTGGRLNAAGALRALTADVTPPAAPTGVSATGGVSQVALDWADNLDDDLAGYRVYAAGTAQVLAQPAVSAAAVTGLGAGVAHGFEVTAFDLAGNESARSAAVTARTAVLAALGSVPGPGATLRPRVSAALAGLRVRCGRECRPRSVRLTFTLRAASPVQVVAARRVCRRLRCRYGTAGTRVLRLAAGLHTQHLRRSFTGAKLRPGRWRLTLRTPDDTASVSFRVSSD